jgi:glucose/mannose transport system substrate-binding protein
VKFKRITALASACLATSLVVTACGGSDNNSSGSKGNAKDIEVFSWWTSGSEAAALQVLIDKFKVDTGEDVSNAAVSGGGGANARQALATRLQGGDPPDSWQLHPDKDLAAAVQDGTVGDISSLYEQGKWADVIPQAVLDMLKTDGKYYAVPVNAHRANVLWTNPKVLQDNGITWTASTTPDQFMSDAKKLHDDGVTPLCVGDKDIFASAQLLETLIIGQVGPEGWKQLNSGDMNWDDAKVKAGVQEYVDLMGWANKDHSALTWDQAAINMAKGQCAANLMGDWAYGELLNKGYQEDTDFGYVTMPGTGDVFDFVGDAFVKPEKGPNPTGEDGWLKTLLDPKTQADFNLKKGSTPIRTDIDMASFPAYQQQAAKDFRSLQIVSSLAHAEIAPAEFAQAYADAVTALNGDMNVDNFVSTMNDNQSSLLQG